MLKFLSYVPTIAALLVISVLLFVNAGKDNAKRSFAWTATIITVWVASLGVADNTTSTQTALYFVRQAVFFANLIPISFLFFSLSFGQDYLAVHRKVKMLLLAVPPVILALLSFSPQMIESVKIESYGAVIEKANILYTFHSATSLIYFVTAFIILLLKRKRVDGTTRNQIQLILWGAGTAYVANLISGTILAQSGFQGPAILLGTFSIVVFAIVVSFAIIRGRLFDVRLATVRVVTFILSVGFLAIIYGYVAFGLTEQFFFTKIFITRTSQQLFNTVLAIILAFTFPWIRRFFERITDRIFYRDRYDPQILISDIGRVLATEIELTPLTKKVLQILTNQMRLAESNIVVMGDEGIFYQTHQDKIHQAYHPDDLKMLRDQVTITDELPASEKREMLERHNVRAGLTLKTKESFVGYLLIGDKRSGDIFTNEDTQTLGIIADELAVAIQNARSYQEIQQFNATLREKVKQATTDLRHVNNELKDLDKAKDEFISMASHQLRTPLTAVRGYTSMVMDGDFGKVSKDQKETLKQSFDAATRMVRLVDDLLNVSRIQSGKFHVERTQVDLNIVLPEEVSLLETTAGNKKVTLTFHPPKQPVPALSLDEGKTRQALMNLMDNAIYYSSAAETGGKVEVTLDHDDQNVIFRVSDNGIGVPKDQQSKLFKKFYRAPNAQKTRPDGTGLGLFLVGKVVSAQGGKIIFESVEGKGSTFGFSLPIKPSGDDLVEAPKAGADTSSAGSAPAESTTAPVAKPKPTPPKAK